MGHNHDDSECKDKDRLLLEVGCKLACAIEGLTEYLKHNHLHLILHRIGELEQNIMSQISDYAGRVNTAFDAIGTSVDEIVSAQTGLTGDVAELKRIILALQNNPGPISPEDQALLDAGEVKINALATKTAAVASALKDLDAQTETAPTVPPTP